MIRRAPAPLALMALIFFFSSQSDLGTDLGIIDLIGRKIAHATIFAGLTLLWWWALDLTAGHGGDVSGTGRRPRLWGAALISFLYAVSDEFHQSFVDGRVGSPVDVGIDTVGIAFACWLVASGKADGLLAKVSARR